MSVKFDICKEYFFVLPSIQIITAKLMESKLIIDIDWLCFHLNIRRK